MQKLGGLKGGERMGRIIEPVGIEGWVRVLRLLILIPFLVASFDPFPSSPSYSLISRPNNESFLSFQNPCNQQSIPPQEKREKMQ